MCVETMAPQDKRAMLGCGTSSQGSNETTSTATKAKMPPFPTEEASVPKQAPHLWSGPQA